MAEGFQSSTRAPPATRYEAVKELGGTARSGTGLAASPVRPQRPTSGFASAPVLSRRHNGLAAGWSISGNALRPRREQ